MNDQNNGHPTTNTAQLQKLLLELMKFRFTPAQAPQQIIADIVKLVDSSYKSLGLYACGGEAFIIKVETPLGDERCLKMIYPSDGIEGQRTVTLWEKLGFSVKSESVSKLRFIEAAKTQQVVAKAIQEAKLNYLYVPVVHKISCDPSYLEMEWIPSVPVLEWLHEQRNLLTSLQCFSNLCKAVHFIHERGIIHRDLKPDNIYIWNNLGVCILDWSVAKPIGDRNLTLTGMMIGSKPYISPVQAEMAKSATHLDDIHCLGYIFATFVMDKDLPVVLDNKMEYKKVLPKFRAAILEKLPEATRQVFTKATEINEDNRYQTAEEFQVAVDQIIVRLSSPSPEVFTPQPSVVVKPTASVSNTSNQPQDEKPKKISEMGYFETLALARHLSESIVKDCTKYDLSTGGNCPLDTCDNCRNWNESLIILIVKIITTMQKWGYL